MDMPLAERLLRAFLMQMMRAEAIDPDDIAEAADRLSEMVTKKRPTLCAA